MESKTDMRVKTVYLASDHGGFRLKEDLRAHLDRLGLTVVDLGPARAESCDYPPFAHAVCRRVLTDPDSLGILVCGTGLGMSMAANRLPGIRAALCTSEYAARMTREHNDANVLCLGERVTGPGLAVSITETFLATEFQGGRHQRRIELIETLNGIESPDSAQTKLN